MTEIERVYRDDIREKKSIKNSVNKTNRTGKGPIRFPSDYLTRKEKQALNSECKSWKFSEFPDRRDFDQMSDDIKISYLNWMLNVYNVGIANISEIVFGQSSQAFHSYLKRHPEITTYVNVPSHGFKSSAKDRQRFEHDVRIARAPKIEPEPEEVKDGFTPDEKAFISTYLAPISEEKTESQEPINVDICESESETEETPIIPVKSIDFTMDGFDMELLDMVRSRFGNSKIRVRIIVEAIE